jgi:Phage integrase family
VAKDLQVNLMHLAYADRQLIVVRPDDDVMQARQAKQPSQTTADPRPDPAGGAAGIGGAALPMGLPLNLVSRWRTSRAERRELFVLPVMRNEATQLRFPVGHPPRRGLRGKSGSDDDTDPRKPVRRTAKLLFVNGNGDPIHRASWSQPWAPAVERVGLPKGFGYHGLRHYFATLLIHAGASVKTVQLALGHSTPAITLNTYTHEWPDAVDRTRNLVDAALGRAGSAVRAAG